MDLHIDSVLVLQAYVLCFGAASLEHLTPEQIAEGQSELRAIAAGTMKKCN